MNCRNCGFPLRNSDKFCGNCGTPIEQINTQSVQQSINNAPNKKLSPIIIVLIIILSFGLLIGGYIGIKYVLKNFINIPSEHNSEINQHNQTDPIFFTDKEAEDLECGDYTFKVPMNYSYGCGNHSVKHDIVLPSRIHLFDFSGTAILFYLDDSLDIEMLDENIELFKPHLNDFYYSNFDVFDLKIEAINKIEMLTYKGSSEDLKKMVGAIVPVDSSKSLYIFAESGDDKYDYELIKEVTMMAESLFK